MLKHEMMRREWRRSWRRRKIVLVERYRKKRKKERERRGTPGVVAKVLNYDILACEFELQWYYYVPLSDKYP